MVFENRTGRLRLMEFKALACMVSGVKVGGLGRLDVGIKVRRKSSSFLQQIFDCGFRA